MDAMFLVNIFMHNLPVEPGNQFKFDIIIGAFISVIHVLVLLQTENAPSSPSKGLTEDDVCTGLTEMAQFQPVASTLNPEG